MTVNVDEIRADIAAMGEALMAISKIPTQRRRRIAFDWLVSRVDDDLRKLAVAEHEERIVALVGAVFGEPESADAVATPSQESNARPIA